MLQKLTNVSSLFLAGKFEEAVQEINGVVAVHPQRGIFFKLIQDSLPPFIFRMLLEDLKKKQLSSFPDQGAERLFSSNSYSV